MFKVSTFLPTWTAFTTTVKAAISVKSLTQMSEHQLAVTIHVKYEKQNALVT